MSTVNTEELSEALKLAEGFGDGDAGVTFKRKKNHWYAYLFFDISAERLGFVENGWGDSPEEALGLLLDRVRLKAKN